MLFQFHVTIDSLPKEGKDIFVQICESEKVKPVLIELEKGDHIHQPMFTQMIEAKDLNSALDMVKNTNHKFEEKGFRISRIKAEIDPKCNKDYLCEKNYYEWHCLVEFTDEAPLKEVCIKNNAHLSLNSLTPGRKFVTIRCYDHDQFYQQIETTVEALKAISLTIIKQKFEYTIYDTKLELDKGWA